MAKYHINPTTGAPRICKANSRECPLGVEHFDSKEAAYDKIEDDLSSNFAKTATLSKGDFISETMVKSSSSLLAINNNSNGSMIKKQQVNAWSQKNYISAMKANTSNISKDYPVGSIVEISSRTFPSVSSNDNGRKFFNRRKNEEKTSSGLKIRGRIVDVNDFDFIVIDSETGKKYSFGMDEGAEREVFNYNINFISKTVDDGLDSKDRVMKARKSFDSNFNIGDDVHVISNFEYNSRDNGIYKIFHKGPSAVSLENANGKIFTLSNDQLEENNYYNFLKNDISSNFEVDNGVSKYLDNQYPYPVDGWGNNYNDTVNVSLAG